VVFSETTASFPGASGISPGVFGINLRGLEENLTVHRFFSRVPRSLCRTEFFFKNRFGLGVETRRPAGFQAKITPHCR